MNKKNAKRANKVWNNNELDFLMNKWGILTAKKIGSTLGRTESAVTDKAKKLRLGGVLVATEQLTAAELSRVCGVDKSTVINWIKYRGLAAKYQAIRGTRKYYRIKIDDFWKWAEKHHNSIKWDIFEKNILGPEPLWVDKVRKNYKKIHCKKYTVWTDQELNFLRNNYKSMTNVKIAEHLNRTTGSVAVRLNSMGLKRYDSIKINWKPIEIEMLIDFYNKGIGLHKIAYELGRSVPSVRFKRDRLIEKKIIPPLTKKSDSITY